VLTSTERERNWTPRRSPPGSPSSVHLACPRCAPGYALDVADPRTQLPVGDWQLHRTAVQPPDARVDVAWFWVFATDRVTGDRVGAYVTIGQGSHSHEDWGLPSDLPLERVWYLANLDERSGAKARGGTAAVVRCLARLADREGMWLTTEVQPHNRALEKIIMALLAKHAAFMSPDPEFAAMMIRSPRVAPAPAAIGK
jgi:hypothetical protein